MTLLVTSCSPNIKDRIAATKKAKNAIPKQSPTKTREGIFTKWLDHIDVTIGRASNAAMIGICFFFADSVDTRYQNGSDECVH